MLGSPLPLSLSVRGFLGCRVSHCGIKVPQPKHVRLRHFLRDVVWVADLLMLF